MNDIITTMFNKKFLEELFKPQELYSKKALRTVFDRLAHASIMRLNQASMDKVKTKDNDVLPYWEQTALFLLVQFLHIFLMSHTFYKTLCIHSKQIRCCEQFLFTVHLYYFMLIFTRFMYKYQYVLKCAIMINGSLWCVIWWNMYWLFNCAFPMHSSMTWWPWHSSIRSCFVLVLKTSSLYPSTIWMPSGTLWKTLPASSAKWMKQTNNS